MRGSRAQQSSATQPAAEPTPPRYEDQAAVAACAELAGLDHQRAEAAMIAADRYWIIALRMDGTAESERTPGLKRAEIAEVRRGNADVFGRSRTKPPKAQRLATYLRRVAGLTAEEANRFIIAHADHLNKKADALFARLHSSAGGQP